MNIGKTGEIGEQKVAQFLRRKGFNIVKRNYQCRFGEVDIIAENDEYILFVEVKTRIQDGLVSGEYAVDYHKQQRIIMTAKDYIRKSFTELQPRFDVAVVTVYKRPDETDGYKLKYIKNAF